MTDKEYDPSKARVVVTYDGETLFEGTPSILKYVVKGDIEAMTVTASKKSVFKRADDYDTEKAIERMPEPARQLIRDYNEAVTKKGKQ